MWNDSNTSEYLPSNKIVVWNPNAQHTNQSQPFVSVIFETAVLRPKYETKHKLTNLVNITKLQTNKEVIQGTCTLVYMRLKIRFRANLNTRIQSYQQQIWWERSKTKPWREPIIEPNENWNTSKRYCRVESN